MDQLIEVPFHRALHRANLIWGGEREPMIFSMILVGAMIVPAMNLVSTIVGAVFGLLAVLTLRAMAKSDPQMSVIFMRQCRYKDYYPAHSRYARVSKSPRVY
jgi:type IV secretory pathway TrbD component